MYKVIYNPFKSVRLNNCEYNMCNNSKIWIFRENLTSIRIDKIDVKRKKGRFL